MPTQRALRRVVVTGLGVVSPIGNSLEEFWQNLLAGQCGIQRIDEWDTEGYPAHFAGKVTGFDATKYLTRQQVRRTSRFSQFGVTAALDALADSGLDMDAEDGERVAISMGTAVAGMEVVEGETPKLIEKGPRRVNPMLIPSIIGNMAGCLVSIMLKTCGPVLCPVGACATGCMAIGDAFELVARGEADVAIAGGAEAVTTPLSVAAFGRLGALSRNDEDATLVCRPFDADRDGTVLSEGAAAVVLESEDHARARGAKVLAELAGYGLTSDGYHVAAPDPSGNGAARAMQKALTRGGIQLEEVSYVCAHGTGTPLNDIAESNAIRQVFGDHVENVLVSSNKYTLGHTLGAAGALSAVATVQSIGAGVVPGTLNLRHVDPECKIRVIAENVVAEVDAALVNALGFGGQNASLVFRRWRAE